MSSSIIVFMRRVASFGFGLVVLVSTLASGLCVACGGGPSSSNTGGPASPSSKPETFAEVNPADVAQLTPEAQAAIAAPGSGGGQAPAAAASSEPVDECTPVGVDFEKRVRPKLKDCYAEAKKKSPDLQGSVRISVDIDTLGKIKSTKIVEKTLPEPVAQCMLKVVKAAPFPEAGKCPGKSVTIPVTFPTPR